MPKYDLFGIYRPSVSTTLVKDPDNPGHVMIHPMKQHMRPFWLTTEPDVVTIPNGEVVEVPMPIDNQGPVELFYGVCQDDDTGGSTGNWTVQLFDAEDRALLSNRPILAANFSGDLPGRPYVWPEPYLIHPERHGRVLFVSLQNLSGSTRKIRFALFGRRLFRYQSPPELVEAWERYTNDRKWSTPWFYTTDNQVVMLAGGSTSKSIRISDDSDFEVWRMTAASRQLNTPGANLTFTTQMFEQNTGRPLSNRPIHSDDQWGIAGFPFQMFERTVFDRNFQIRIDFVNLAGVTVDTHVCLAGRKLHYVQG